MEINKILNEIDEDDSDIVIESLVDLVEQMNNMEDAEGTRAIAIQTFKLGKKFENVAFAMLADTASEE